MSFPGRQFLRRVLGRPVWRNAECCFALSTGRTGSQTLTSLLNLSSSIRAFHEPAPLLLEETKQAYLEIDQDQQRFEQIFAEAKSTEIGIARLRGYLYAETSNRLTFLAPAISDLLPNAKFIFLHRHPAEVVRSGMRRGWYRDHPWDPYRISPRPDDAAYEAWPRWDCFRKACWYWSAINEFSASFVAQLPRRQCLTLRFDDFMDRDSSAWQQVFAHLNLEPPAFEAVQSVFARKDNQQAQGEFPLFSAWSDEQKSILMDIAGETMERLGYSIEETAECI